MNVLQDDEDTLLREYDALPESIKAIYSPKEYRWMTDIQRANLVREECEPEWEEI